MKDRLKPGLGRVLVWCLLSLGATTAGLAQDFEYGGYLEHQLNPQGLQDRVVFMDYSKVRLDLTSRLSDRFSVTGDYVLRIQHGQKNFNSLDFMPSRTVQEYAASIDRTPGSLREGFNFRLKNENYVDNLFVSYYSDRLSVRVGRQQIPMGTGYVWNPTDIFHDKNQLDPTYEKRGVDAVKVEIPLTDMSAITGVVGFGDGWDKATKSLQFRSHAKGFDFSISAMEKSETRFYFNRFSEGTERRRLLAADASGTMKGIGVWFEGAYNDPEFTDSYSQFLIGADYTLESGLYLITEYYSNGKGVAGKTEYDLQRWMDFLGAAGENLGQHFLFVGQTYPLTDLLTGSNFTIVNLDDGSAVVYPYFEYSLSDNAVLTLIGYLTLGKSDSEFGAFGSGAILRGRLYF
jgi:hypothetical protein